MIKIWSNRVLKVDDFMNDFKEYKIVKGLKGTCYNYFILRKDGIKYFAKIFIEDKLKYKNKLNNEINLNKILKEFSFLPKIRDYSIEDSFIIYDYIDGKTLNLYKNLDDNMIINVLIVVAGCLEKLHSKNIVHCDIKSENIMIDREGNIFFIDFENANFINNKVHFGTKRYCSVEQLRGTPVNIQFDIYSFGVMMYELLTGKIAYDGIKDEELVSAKMNYVLAINEANKNVPKFADYILFKALGFNNEYYGSISELKKDLYLLKSKISL